MSDEGIGIAGWLLADLVLVLAVVFLAFTPPALSGGSDAPIILDIGCVVQASDGRTDVTCTPEVSGEGPFSYEWTAEFGEPAGAINEPSFMAWFEGAGAVRLAVGNYGGARSAAFPVLPSALTPTAPPRILDIGCAARALDGTTNVTCRPEVEGGGSLRYEWRAERGRTQGSSGGERFTASFEEPGAIVLTVSNDGDSHDASFPVLPPRVVTPQGYQVVTDFRFDQIVLTGVEFGSADWESIKAGAVRENLIKRDEDEPRDPEWSLLTDVEAFLRAKREDGLRIALVETFAHDRVGDELSVRLARKVNDVLYDGLVESGLGDIFVDCEPRENWFADYRDASLAEGEVRINVFFVRPRSDRACP